MSKRLAAAFSVALLSTITLAPMAHAADEVTVGKHAGAIIVNLRGTVVDPVGSSPILTAAGGATGLSATADSSVVPSLGISYFFTDNIAAELILATSEHSISAVSSSGSTLVHKTWVLPPVVSLQYHFAPHSQFSPYVGAGVNYMIFYSGKDYNGFTVRPHDGFGAAVEGGADFAVNKRVNVNVDVKKVFFRTDADINGGAFKSHVHLDPWVISAGLGVKF
ncbi:OmpW/AlkL family protein [Caulobacter sp. KR2-114]|uniref:OmpW/AlkL family protein n=1 Tax=Caulobacter sp. KR2-114 TaxID=3400912 RepID=UPI003BFFA02E